MMFHEVKGIPGSKDRWRVTCDKHLNHQIQYMTSTNNGEIIEDLEVAIYMNKHIRAGINRLGNTYAHWNFKKQHLTITDGFLGETFYEPNSLVPWFEPDLSEYDKLIKKLKTYLTFS